MPKERDPKVVARRLLAWVLDFDQNLHAGQQEQVLTNVAQFMTAEEVEHLAKIAEYARKVQSNEPTRHLKSD
jgi:hypothetical protein